MWPIGLIPFASSSIVPNTSRPLRSSLPSLIRVVGRSCSTGAIGRRTPVSRSKTSSPPCKSGEKRPPSERRKDRQDDRAAATIVAGRPPGGRSRNGGQGCRSIGPRHAPATTRRPRRARSPGQRRFPAPNSSVTPYSDATVGQLALSGTIANGSSVYGAALAPGAATLVECSAGISSAPARWR